MISGDSAPAGRPERDVLTITPGELRDTIRLTIDRELVDELDRRRGSVSRSEDRNVRSRAARSSASASSCNSHAPRSCAPTNTAHAAAASNPAPNSRCHSPPGLNDHRSSHGSNPSAFSRCAIGSTTA